MAFIFISDLWNKWNIRGVVILSLLFQVFLILFAPIRKKIANKYIISLLWLVYLMADSIVVYGIGLISHNQGNPSTRGAEVNGAVQAFWVSFLLLHLGGPDTITAFSLEDNSLWKRHLLSLIFQVGAAIYVFVQIFPTDELLVIPTMLVFSLGVIKNVERILALRLSNLPRIRESMNTIDFDRISAELLPQASDVYEYSNEEGAKLAESIVVEHAYAFFQVFQVFLVDIIFSLKQRHASIVYFHKVSPVDALRVISVELQFMYEMLHTKALAIRSKWSYIFRVIALNVLAMAFILFNRLKKHRLFEVDIKITYSLLCGGIALDVTALFMLVFSDWTIGEIMWQCTTLPKLKTFLQKVVSVTDNLRKPQFAEYEAEPTADHTYEVLDTPLIFRRWSESISACNLFSEVMEESPRKMKKCNRGRINIAFRMAGKIASSFRQTRKTVVECCSPRTAPSVVAHAKYVSKNPLNNKLWIFIFAEVKRKFSEIQHPWVEIWNFPVEREDELRDIFEARGDKFLKRSKLKKLQKVDFEPYITGCNYDSSILFWHIATEWWYHNEESTGRNEEREFSKILSDYMFYLLLKQPNVMFAVAGNAQFTSGQIMEKLRMGAREVKEMLSMPLSEVVEISHLYKALPGFELAQKLGELGERKWEVMSGVWVEMLCYAAGHIRGESHAQVLSKGGELLSFVWLLMAHFGCLFKDPWGPWNT